MYMYFILVPISNIESPHEFTLSFIDVHVHVLKLGWERVKVKFIRIHTILVAIQVSLLQIITNSYIVYCLITFSASR